MKSWDQLKALKIGKEMCLRKLIQNIKYQMMKATLKLKRNELLRFIYKYLLFNLFHNL